MHEKIDYEKVDINAEAPITEPERQHYFIAKAKKYVQAESARLERSLTFCVTTFGCQMNSEHEMAKSFIKQGFQKK